MAYQHMYKYQATFNRHFVMRLQELELVFGHKETDGQKQTEMDGQIDMEAKYLFRLSMYVDGKVSFFKKRHVKNFKISSSSADKNFWVNC